MQGIHRFLTLEEALQAGFIVYDRTASGYIVHGRVDGRWAMAVVEARI